VIAHPLDGSVPFRPRSQVSHEPIISLSTPVRESSKAAKASIPSPTLPGAELATGREPALLRAQAK
jgi:hypothetical protein